MKKCPALRGGFGLIEIVVAVILIGVLVAVVSPSAFRYVEKSKYQEVVRDFRAIEQALAGYYADVGTLAPLDDIHDFSTSAGSPAYRHFLAGDDQEGWDGPYLDHIKVGSSFGGTYDVDVMSSSQASIDLGTKSRMGLGYQEVLEAMDGLLDEDGDLTRGAVWGDSNGIHFGFNYHKN